MLSARKHIHYTTSIVYSICASSPSRLVAELTGFVLVVAKTRVSIKAEMQRIKIQFGIAEGHCLAGRDCAGPVSYDLGRHSRTSSLEAKANWGQVTHQV